MRTKLTRLKVLRESKIRAAHVPNLYKLGALKGLDINPTPDKIALDYWRSSDNSGGNVSDSS